MLFFSDKYLRSLGPCVRYNLHYFKIHMTWMNECKHNAELCMQKNLGFSQSSCSVTPRLFSREICVSNKWNLSSDIPNIINLPIKLRVTSSKNLPFVIFLNLIPWKRTRGSKSSSTPNRWHLKILHSEGHKKLRKMGSNGLAKNKNTVFNISPKVCECHCTMG